MVGRDNEKRYYQALTEARSAHEDPLPLFLSDYADEYEQRSTSRFFKASIMVAAAVVSSLAITLSLGNPDVAASLTYISALLPGTGQSTPTVRSTADAEALPPTTRMAPPIRDEIAVTFDRDDQSQTEINEASSGALLKQFQTWAAQEDARAQVEPVRSVQDPRAQVLQNAQAPVRHIQKHRRVRLFQNARAEIRRDTRARASEQKQR